MRRPGHAPTSASRSTVQGGGGGIRTHGGVTHTRFRGVLLWPLGHATVEQVTGAPGGGIVQRLAAKKSTSSVPHSSSSTPPTTSGRWLSRRSRTTSHNDPTAPAFGSQAPNTSRL